MDINKRVLDNINQVVDNLAHVNKTIFKNDSNKIDPLQREKVRSYAFYPYSKNQPQLTFKLDLKTKRIDKLIPKEIELTIESKGKDEQIESWKRVFGLDERYKALLCSPSAGKDWYNSIMDEYLNAEELSNVKGAEEYYKVMLKDSKKNLISGHGFIKSVF